MQKENMKPKKKKNNHEKFWKIIHVISYILSITFIFFIIIACVEGCQQKDNIQSQRNNNQLVEKSNNYLTIDNNTIYLYLGDLTSSNFYLDLWDYLYSKNSTLDTLNTLPFTCVAKIMPYNNSTTVGRTYTTFLLLNDSQEYPKRLIRFNVGSTLVATTKLDIYRFNSSQDYPYIDYGGSGLKSVRLTITNYDNAFYTLCSSYLSSGYTEDEMEEAVSEAYEDGYSEGYSLGNTEGYNSGYEVGYNDGLSVNAEEVTNITIQYDYDFRNLISDNIDINTGLMRVSSSSGGLTTIETLSLSGLIFKVSDNLYNNVIIRTISLSQDNSLAFEDNFDTCRTANELYPNNDYYYYRGLVSVSYRFLDSDNNVVREQRVVNGYSNYSGTNSNGIVVSGCFDFRKPTWVTNAFRFLTIDEDTGTKVNTPIFGNTFTLKELLALDGNVTMSTNNTTTMFSLFSMAFGSVAGILGIAVLPNITLGLLLFIPLIVGIIVLILKAIKK